MVLYYTYTLSYMVYARFWSGCEKLFFAKTAEGRAKTHLRKEGGRESHSLFRFQFSSQHSLNAVLYTILCIVPTPYPQFRIFLRTLLFLSTPCLLLFCIFARLLRYQIVTRINSINYDI